MTETLKKAQEDFARFQAAAEQWCKDFEQWQRERRAAIEVALADAVIVDSRLR